MQATLLGVSIAIILALVAALAGPHFVDWTQYRATFEAEATKLAGMPVRVTGPIDLRLLPTPMLTLGRVEAGRDAREPQMKARELHAELALGSLMRGEVRAAELRIVGPDIKLDLAADGRIAWPVTRMGFNPEQLQIENVAIEDGRLALGDAASGSRFTLEGLWFNGEVRSLAGPVKGEGGFSANGERFSYRINAGKVGDDGAMRVKLGLDPADTPLAVEADGAWRIENGVPRYEGALTLLRPAADKRAVAVPWRATAKVKASPTHALLEQVEYQYGPDERAIKLAGTAEFRFGKAPRLDALLSARQADLDRALALPDPTRRLPLAALKAFIEPFAGAYRPPIPVRIGLGLDSVMLAGANLQQVRGDLKLDGDAWDIETLEFRAPGFSQVRLSGRVAITPLDVVFKGPVQVEATDPKLFAGWLEGNSDIGAGQIGLLRAGGDLTISSQDVAVERLTFEYDRKTVEGRLAYAHAIAGRPARLEAELKAAELDVDGVLAFGRAALDGATFERPGEISLSADIGRATVAGVEVKGVSGKLKFDRSGLAVDRIQVTDLAGAALTLNGRVDGALTAPRGNVTFDIDARGLDGVVAVLGKFLPQAAEPVRKVAATITPLKARATFGVEPAPASAPGSLAKLALDGSAGLLRVKLSGEATGDVATMTLPSLRLDGQVTATDGSALVGLTGLGRILTVDRRAGALNVTARSASGGDVRVDARLNAGGLTSSATGTARFDGTDKFSAALDVALQAADASPLRRGAAAQSNQPLPVALRAKLAASPTDITLDNLAGAIAGAPVRGKLKLTLGAAPRIDGQIDADVVDGAALIAAAIGVPSAPARSDAPLWPYEPFGEHFFGDVSGRVAFNMARATLMPSVAASKLRGVARFGGGEVAFEDVEGTVASGRATGQLTLRRSPDGVAARASVALAGSDAAVLLPSEGRPPVNGRVNLQADVEGAGLSPATLIGSLSGTGLLTLEDAQISGLDPRAFATAVRVVDQAIAVDALKVRDVVSTVLDGGYLGIPRLDAALTIAAGQARIGQTFVYGQGADLALSGGIDLANATLDGRLTLSGPVISEGALSTRPDIFIALKGPLLAPKRTVDVATLSGWLMLRAAERQAKRIETIEAERRDFERREAERREAERREAERLAAARRDAESKSISATTPSSAPLTIPAPAPLEMEAPPTASIPPSPGAPPVLNAPPAVTPALPRPPVRTQTPTPAPAVEQAPPLPPPLNIGPAPGAKSGRASRRNGPPPSSEARSGAQQSPGGNGPPPAPSRSALDALFGAQR